MSRVVRPLPEQRGGLRGALEWLDYNYGRTEASRIMSAVVKEWRQSPRTERLPKATELSPAEKAELAERIAWKRTGYR